MRVEEKLKADPKFNMICALVFGMESALCTDFKVAEDYYGPEDALKQWNGIVETLYEKPWADGEHCGDCTKTPACCHRCLVEEIVEDAEELMQGVQGE